MKHPVVDREAWLAKRKALLAQEKSFSRVRDELSRKRRELPWVKIEKEYVFGTAHGNRTLFDLFYGKRQLIVYHFMFDPEWDEGCKSCSLLADHFDPAVVHLRQRDVSLIAVSRAPTEKLLPFQRRMGWTFPWASSFSNDFNRDYQVTFAPEEIASGAVEYNYVRQPFPLVEAPGASVFYRDGKQLFHTYSTYARGLDLLIGAYNWLDLAPRGRDEGDLPYTMEWVRHHDRYDEAELVDPYVELFGGED